MRDQLALAYPISTCALALDQKTPAYLDLIKRNFDDKDVDDLRQEAVIHLATNVLPRLRGVDGNWEHYLKHAVKNFFLEQVRNRKNVRYVQYRESE